MYEVDVIVIEFEYERGVYYRAGFSSSIGTWYFVL